MLIQTTASRSPRSHTVFCTENSGLFRKGQGGEVPQCECVIKQYCVSLKNCSDKNVDHSAALTTLTK